jgi:hypothetical protein
MRICRALGGMGGTIAAPVARRSSGYRARVMSSHGHVRATRRLAALLITALLVLPATPALAQSPFGSLPQGTPTETQISTSNATSSGSDGVTTFQAVLIVIAAVALLTGIAVVIVRDARRRAPVLPGDSEAAHLAPDAHKGSRAAKQKQRAKAKAVREQRRRNR